MLGQRTRRGSEGEEEEGSNKCSGTGVAIAGRMRLCGRHSGVPSGGGGPNEKEQGCFKAGRDEEKE